MAYSTATLHRAERAAFSRDLAAWEIAHTDPNEGGIAPIRGGSADHGFQAVSLRKIDDPWAVLTGGLSTADSPF